MKTSEWFQNIPAWIFFGLFIIAEFANYTNGRTVTRLCELTEPHDVALSHPRSARDEIDKICIERLPL
jgi:hypothetical protein